MRRRKRNKQRKIITLSMISLLCIMTAGYAAFQTNLNISAKGNIIETEMTIQELKNKYCKQTSGDGLYQDIYEEGRCVYKGNNPNNYMKFNNTLWRIISIEKDGTLKIISEDSIEELAWDTNNKNDWQVASLNTYLNTEYYNKFSSSSKLKIKKGIFNIGKISYFGTLSNSLSEEKTTTHENYIALITASEYMRASSNSNCTGDTVHSYNNENMTIEHYPCSLDNYLYKDYDWYLLSGYTYNNSHIARLRNFGFMNSPSTGSNEASSIRPTLFLNSNIIIKNKGTKDKPYEILE